MDMTIGVRRPVLICFIVFRAVGYSMKADL